MNWETLWKLTLAVLFGIALGMLVKVESDVSASTSASAGYQSANLPPGVQHRLVRPIMRDGVSLMADLYLPEGEGPFPTLVRKTPYSREPRSPDGVFYASNGYAVLIASHRGRFGSEGIFHQSRNEGWLEHKDGYDTVEWAAEQPWSNGKIGTFGVSADAQWQLATAPTRPPHLTAMFTSYAAHHRTCGRIERGIHTSMALTWHHNNNAFPRPLRTREDYESWPLPNTRYEKYYLRTGDGQPTGSLNDVRLLQEAPGAESPDPYEHDPYNPIPTLGGHGGFAAIWEQGPLDQRPAEARTLTYTTDVLEEDLEVVGEIKARFFASSSAVDTDWILTITDVYPSGYSAVLRQNGLQARYRLSEESESLLEPNQIYPYTLTLDGIANVFKKGHRIRVGIASSSFPSFLPNLGTAKPMHLETKGIVANNTIYHDQEHPSYIEIPVHGR